MLEYDHSKSCEIKKDVLITFFLYSLVAMPNFWTGDCQLASARQENEAAYLSHKYCKTSQSSEKREVGPDDTL